MTLQAHAPQNISLEYDLTTQTLTVNIEHWAVTPTVHYIERVDIHKNGKKVEAEYYQNQPDPETFSYTYKIPAVVGDVLQVKANCSVSGSKTAVLKIKPDRKEKPEKEDSDDQEVKPEEVTEIKIEDAIEEPTPETEP